MKSSKFAFLLPFIGIMLTACGTPIEAIALKKLALEGRRFSQDDFATKEKLDFSTVAIFSADRSVLSPNGEIQCHGYCLRLLYSGEAKTVIVGYLKMPIFSLETRKQIVKKPTEIINANVSALKAFTIEKHDNCPDAKFSESEDLRSRDEKNEIYSYSITNAAAQNVLTGNCLISSDTDLSQVTAILEIAGPNSIYMAGRKNYYSIRTLRVFKPLPKEFFQAVFQKTIVWSNVESSMGKVFEGLGAASHIGETNEKRTPVEIFMKEFGLKFKNFEAPPIDLTKAAKKFTEFDRELTSDETSILQNYANSIKERSALTETDKKILTTILREPHFSKAIFSIAPAFDKSNKDTGFLGEIVFDDIIKTRERLKIIKDKEDNHLRNVIFNQSLTETQKHFLDIEYRKSATIGEDEALRNRLLALSQIGGSLSKGAFVANEDKYLKILSLYNGDGYGNEMLHRMHTMPFEKTRQFYAKLLSDSKDDYKAVAAMNLCFHGQKAKEFLPKILTLYIALPPRDRASDTVYLPTIITMSGESEIINKALAEEEKANINRVAANFKSGQNVCAIGP